MKLTKQEREIILRAVEMIDKGECVGACVAICRAQNLQLSTSSLFSIRFAEFYGFIHRQFWPFGDTTPDTSEERKLWRMNNLLLFMHAAGEEG